MTANRDSKEVTRKYADHFRISYIEAARKLAKSSAFTIKDDETGTRYTITCNSPWDDQITPWNGSIARYLLFTSDDRGYMTTGLHLYMIADQRGPAPIPARFMNKLRAHARTNWGMDDQDAEIAELEADQMYSETAMLPYALYRASLSDNIELHIFGYKSDGTGLDWAERSKQLAGRDRARTAMMNALGYDLRHTYCVTTSSTDVRDHITIDSSDAELITAIGMHQPRIGGERYDAANPWEPDRVTVIRHRDLEG